MLELSSLRHSAADDDDYSRQCTYRLTSMQQPASINTTNSLYWRYKLSGGNLIMVYPQASIVKKNLSYLRKSHHLERNGYHMNKIRGADTCRAIYKSLSTLTTISIFISNAVSAVFYSCLAGLFCIKGAVSRKSILAPILFF